MLNIWLHACIRINAKAIFSGSQGVWYEFKAKNNIHRSGQPRVSSRLLKLLSLHSNAFVIDFTWLFTRKLSKTEIDTHFHYCVSYTSHTYTLVCVYVIHLPLTHNSIEVWILEIWILGTQWIWFTVIYWDVYYHINITLRGFTLFIFCLSIFSSDCCTDFLIPQYIYHFLIRIRFYFFSLDVYLYRQR